MQQETGWGPDPWGVTGWGSPLEDAGGAHSLPDVEYADGVVLSPGVFPFEA